VAIHKKKTSKIYDVDRMMRNLAYSLIRDFQVNLIEPGFYCEFQHVLRTGTIAGIRQFISEINCSDDNPYLQKVVFQLQSIFKRYRFQQDIYSDSELESKSIQDFLHTQDRLADVDLDSLSVFSQRILDQAARYVAATLGPYSDEEHRSLCRFGRRASVGIPARKACEGARWELPISGSREQISWFDSEMSQVDCVQEYWMSQLESDPNRSIYQETSSLKLTLVPKTFKSLRSIMPNTTIGSYMSFGLGEIIRKRLKRVGYDIRTLQMKHRSIACRASIHGLYVTADLSSASDSITVALVKRLFPPDWFDILTRSRIGTVELPDGTCIESQTFCTMGIGYTFPLQTLVFLCLLKAIEAICYDRNDKRLISVYGDDLIYSSRMHELVLRFFGEFGFVINVDKTFSTGHFRESCGGDYYRGVDVRPFQPRNGSAMVSQKAYEATLYKSINGLLMRWSECEIGNTLDFLMRELETCTGKAKLVPGDFPDDSGIKCPTLTTHQFLSRFEVAKPKYLGHGVYRFSYLRLVSDLGKEYRHGPYLWSALRDVNRTADCCAGRFDRQVVPPPKMVAQIEQSVGIGCREPLLIWKEVDPIMTVRSQLTGRRLRRLMSYVTISHSGHYTRQSGTSGFEDRRQ
jgi:hypothetical protein